MRIIACFSLLALLVLGACSAHPPQPASPQVERDIAALEAAFLALGDGVDPDEAARAARIAHEYPKELARRYRITDPPIIHNTKVNMGLRDRGLCWHWADDMQERMWRESFQTLELHRAIANHDRPLLLEHSTLIVSRRGDDMAQGIVLDPWRHGGILFWSPTRDDPKYHWHPREEVFALRRAAATSPAAVAP